MPERDVLEPDGCGRTDDPRKAADALGDDWVLLVRHRGGTLLPAAERLLDFCHLGAGEVSDLERELLERGRGDRKRGEQLGVPVALKNLRRRRRGLEAEPLAGDPLDLGVGCGVGTNGARELAHAHPLEPALEPRTVTLKLEGPAGQLEPERGRLRVDAVRTADLERLAVLLRPRHDGAEGPFEAGHQQFAGVAYLEREARVDDVGRGQAVVKPAAGVAELTPDHVDERGHIMVDVGFDLFDPLG